MSNLIPNREYISGNCKRAFVICGEFLDCGGMLSGKK